MIDSSEPSAVEATVQIRRARPQDRGFIRELAEKVFAVYGSYDRYLTEWSDGQGTTTLIGEVGDQPVALAMLAVHPSPRNPGAAVAELLAIAVDPRFQSRGIGAILLETAIDETSRLPAPFPIVEIHLSVAEGNARAQRLFARRGFRFTAGEGVYPAGQRALHMVKVF